MLRQIPACLTDGGFRVLLSSGGEQRDHRTGVFRFVEVYHHPEGVHSGERLRFVHRIVRNHPEIDDPAWGFPPESGMVLYHG